MQLRSRCFLSEYIRLLGFSGREFASAAGLSHSTVNHLLTGRRVTCSVETAYAIEATLNCPEGLVFQEEN